MVKTCFSNMDNSVFCVGEPENPTGGVQSTPFKQARRAMKRKCNFNMLDVEDVDSGLAHWPRFLVIESVSSDRPVTSLSPFAIAKALQGCIGTAKDVKKLRSGAILVELEKQKQSERLMGLTSMVDIPIKVSPHRSLNSCKGVVRSFDLAQMDKDELLAGLATQNVVDVRNISVTRNGEKQRTNRSFLAGRR